jgi:hypothetical protein
MKELSVAPLIEVKPTLRLAFKIWWAYVGRYLVTVIVFLPIDFVLGMGIGYIVVIKLGFSTTVNLVTCYIAGFIMGVPVMVIPIRLIIGKQFKGFQLALIQRLDVLDKSQDEQMKSREGWLVGRSKRRYFIVASLFSCSFAASTTALLIIHRSLLSGGIGGGVHIDSDVPTVVSVLTAIVSALGIISTAILAWRKDRREAHEYELKIAQLERELATVREKSALPAPNENPK